MRVSHSKAFPTALLLGLLLAFTTSTGSVQPNYTKTTVYDVNVAGDDVETKVFTNGLGQSIQAQTRVSGKEALISAQEYDDAGRPSKSYKAFTHETDLDYFSADEVLEEAKGYYKNVPGGEYGKPYSETDYYNDPLSRVKAAGAPGKVYSIEENPVKSWYLGTKMDPETQTDHQGPRGFLNSTGLKILSGQIEGELDMPASGEATHFLSISMDPDGNFSQSMTTVFGNTVLTWADPDKDTDGDEIIAEYEYDILGNVLTEIPPTDNGTRLLEDTKIRYNTLGQVIERESPDAGTRYYWYDDAGRLRHEWYSRNKQQSHVSWITYDSFGRTVCIHDYVLPFFKPLVENTNELISISSLHDHLLINDYARSHRAFASYYDQLPNSGELSALGVSPPDPRNARGRLVLQASYDQSGKNSVVDWYSYTPEGLVEFQIRYVPSLAPQHFIYTYDDHGKVIELEYRAGDTQIHRHYDYDSHGRLAKVSTQDDGHEISLISYQYNERGMLTTRHFYDGSGRELTSTIQSYNIRDWVVALGEARAGPRYFEKLDYIGTGTGSYRGNIQAAKHHYDGKGASIQYKYDEVNRLSRTTASPLNDGGKLDMADYDEKFGYDRIGRFEHKRTGANSEQKSYTYYNTVNNERTNRLRHVEGQVQNNYIYDKLGNLVVDCEKKVRMEYDSRNLPVKFQFYASMPNLIPNARGEYAGDLDAQFANHERVSEVIMVYDAGGSRVLKAERTDFGPVPVYKEAFEGTETLSKRGFTEGRLQTGDANRWGLNTNNGTLVTNENAGGWQQMASAICKRFSVRRSKGPITAEWSVRFPTDNSGKSWREQNKVWFSLLDQNGHAAYTLRFKPNRRQDLQTSPDMKLYKGDPYAGLQEVSTRMLTPSGSSALPVKFQMKIDQSGTIKVFYDCRDGNGMKEYISVEDSDYASFGGIRIEYKTGDPGKPDHYYIEVDDIRILRPGEPETAEEFLAMSNSATAYVNGFAVYEQKQPGANLELAYTNISTSVGGVEGRVEYTDAGEKRFFYLKDHLGSNRVVIFEEDGTSGVKEAVAYTAYGEMRDVTTVFGGTGAAREKFTGKEFDEEGKAKFAAVELDIDISNISFLSNGSAINCQITFLDGSTEYMQFFGNGSSEFFYVGPKTIKEVYVSSNLTEPIISYGVFSDDGNGLQTIESGERCVIQLSGDAAQFASGMDAPNEWGQFAVAISQEENGVEGIQAYHFGARMYDPEAGVFLSTDPAGQYVNPYTYTGGNPIMLVDPNGETAVGAIIGGIIGAYAGGAMANGSFNPGQWDWENPGTYFGMIQGGIGGAQLGNCISDAIIARPRHMSGAQIDNTQLGAGEYEMKQQFPADDATPLQNKTRIALEDYVNDKPWRQKYEWGIVSESTPDGGLDYRIWQGTKNTISQPPSNVNESNYSVAMHTHTIKGAVPSSDILHYTKGSSYYFVEKANDANWARGLAGRGFRGDYMVYNMPDKTLWGYQIAPKGVGIQFWQVNF